METDIDRRLAAQELLLHAILAAVVPTEDEGGSSFDDLVDTLADLTTAVAELAEIVRGLRCNACGTPRAGGQLPFAGI